MGLPGQEICDLCSEYMDIKINWCNETKHRGALQCLARYQKKNQFFLNFLDV